MAVQDLAMLSGVPLFVLENMLLVVLVVTRSFDKLVAFLWQAIYVDQPCMLKLTLLTL